MKYVPGSGNPNARLLILGEAPSYAETEAGRPFVGPSGKELDKLLRLAGIERGNTWLTNVCKYEVPPPSRIKPKSFYKRAQEAGIDLGQQRIELNEEIQAINPNCILALGGTALWSLTDIKPKTHKLKNEESVKIGGIGKYRGSILKSKHIGNKLVATYHPAHLLHSVKGGEFKGYWNRLVMIFDMNRARQQAHFPEIRLPNRDLQVVRYSYELENYISRNSTNTRPAIDIEAGGHCMPICIGVSFNPSIGLTLPLWNRDGISDMSDVEMIKCWHLMANFLANQDIVGQNFKYDQDKLRRIGFVIRSLASDTMLKAFAINPELPKSLAFNTSLYTEEPYYKDEGMYEGSLLDLFIGCARDACVTKEVDLAMDKDLDEIGQRPFYENFILKLHDLYLDIENEGFNIDFNRREELLRKYIQWDERVRYELFQIAGEYVNCNAHVKVADLLFNKMKLPHRAGTGEEELTALIAILKKPEQKKLCELILEDRRVKKTISTYLMALPDFDGKMKTTFFLCNKTGRTSTGQQDEPIRPSIEVIDEHGKKKWKVLGTAFQTITKHGDIGQDIRSMYTAPDGWKYVQADSSQAEARVVFLLAKDEEALRLVDTNDYHAITASWFFGGTEETHSKKVLGYESPIRFCGKTLRHAGHLGASKKRAALTVNTDARKYKIPISITEMEADRALKIFHQKQPSIQQVFHAGVIDCLTKSRVLFAGLPFGIESDKGGRREFFERWDDDLFREAFSYIPQRSITDNTKSSALRIRDRIRDARIVLESHDALLFLIRDEDIQDHCKIIKEEMERPISFLNCSMPRRSLSIPCELEVGSNYQEFKKFKFSEVKVA